MYVSPGDQRPPFPSSCQRKEVMEEGVRDGMDEVWRARWGKDGMDEVCVWMGVFEISLLQEKPFRSHNGFE